MGVHTGIQRKLYYDMYRILVEQTEYFNIYCATLYIHTVRARKKLAYYGWGTGTGTGRTWSRLRAYT